MKKIIPWVDKIAKDSIWAVHFYHKPFSRDDKGPYLGGKKNLPFISLLFLVISVTQYNCWQLKTLPSRHTEAGPFWFFIRNNQPWKSNGHEISKNLQSWNIFGKIFQWELDDIGCLENHSSSKLSTLSKENDTEEQGSSHLKTYFSNIWEIYCCYSCETCKGHLGLSRYWFSWSMAYSTIPRALCLAGHCKVQFRIKTSRIQK